MHFLFGLIFKYEATVAAVAHSRLGLPISNVCFHGRYQGQSGRAADIAKMALMTPSGRKHSLELAYRP